MNVPRLPVPGLPIDQQPDDILLAMLVWGEARGESKEGRAGVAWVAKNRSVRRTRPIRSIILQPWQFSAFNANDPNRDKMLDPVAFGGQETWYECLAIATGVLDSTIPDPTGGATHYVVASLWGVPTPPGHHVQWYHQFEIEVGHTVETTRIGNHVFAQAA